MMPPLAFKLEMFELGEHLITGNPGGGARGGDGTSQDAGVCPTTGELDGVESYNLSDAVGDCLASEVETAGESGGYPASKKMLAIDAAAAVWPNGLDLLASSFDILFGVEEGVEKGPGFGMGIFFFCGRFRWFNTFITGGVLVQAWVEGEELVHLETSNAVNIEMFTQVFHHQSFQVEIIFHPSILDTLDRS